MIKEIDLNEGDLGIGDFITEIHEFPFIVKIASRILNESRKFTNLDKDKRLSYSIKLRISDSVLINKLIEELEKDLPSNIRFYDVDTRKVFELRGTSGGITTQMCCYLVTRN